MCPPICHTHVMAELVVLDGSRSSITGVTLPTPPPTRIYISGRLYRIAPSPGVALPPVVNVIKAILNWTGPLGLIARNIMYLKGTGSTVTSDRIELEDIADIVKTAWDSTVEPTQSSQDVNL